jgi:hypothetical protein
VADQPNLTVDEKTVVVLSDENEESDDASRERDLIQEAMKRFKLASEAEMKIREEALDDLKFRSGDQWPSQFKQEREDDGRPCLVINTIPQYVQQVTNDQRQNRPSIKIHPLDDQATAETAKVIQGLIRHIEYNSNADTAYDTAFDSAVTGGFGFFRVVPEYTSFDSFDLELKIKRVRNPFSTYLDPNHTEPDGSDAEWGFVVDDMTRDEFKRAFPKSKLAAQGAFDQVGNTPAGWMDGKDHVRVAEYFYKEYSEAEMALLSDGSVMKKDEAESQIKAMKDAHEKALAQLSPEQRASLPAPELPEIVKTRKTMIPKVKWCKITAVEKLEETEFPGSGKYIPIIPVYGTELDIDGEKILEGIVRNAKDPQRMYNYWKSAETEAIALAPRSPFVAAVGQIEGFEKVWATANRRNVSYLPYNPVDVAGTPVPPPQRSNAEPAVQAITQAAMMAKDDLKSTTGIYDASLGAQGNETSGIAIQRRNVQSQTSNFHFMDNLTRSLKHCGRILIDSIPYVYDTERAARIIGEDGTQKVVKLNQEYVDPETKKALLYRLDVGQYDVTVDVGPSFASKRQEAVASMLDLSKSFPQLPQIAGDLMIKNMDWPGASEMADRVKKTLPPGLADDPKAQQIPPQVQAQMQQMSQMIEQLTQQLHVTKDALDKKIPELESKERIEMAKLQAEIEIAMAKMGSQESMALLQHQIGAIEGRVQNLLNFTQPIQGSEQFAPPQAPGAPGADGSQGGPMPTGGQPTPGSPMEGN